ncbi:unnamed protein product [Caenorhabditis nigoni]
MEELVEKVDKESSVNNDNPTNEIEDLVNRADEERLDQVERNVEERLESDEEEMEDMDHEMDEMDDEMDETVQEDSGEWPVQEGGAYLQVLSTKETKSKGHFHNAITSKYLDVEIPRAMMADPQGEELFADSVIRLIHQHEPAAGSQTRMKVGVMFESAEMSESAGIPFKYIDMITNGDIIQNLEDLAQSNKSPLTLEVPRMTMRITYLHPPRGSGKRRFRLENLLEAIVGEKKRRSGGEEEDFEALHNNEDVNGEDDGARGFFDDEAMDAGDDEDDEEDEIENGDEDEEDHKKSGNVMRNDVSQDCLPHAVYQAWMYHKYKNCRSEANREKYGASIRKTDNQSRHKKVHDAVKAMKEKAGLVKTENFDWYDIGLIQDKVFPGLYQIIVFMDTSYVPYYKGPDVGKGKELYILLQDGHYQGFRTLPGLFKTKYYCDICTTGFKSACAHYNCPKIHRICGKEGCKPKAGDVTVACDKCKIEFPSQECYENHKSKGPKGGKSRCDLTVFCKLCKKSYYRNKNARPHVCGEVFCHRCQCPRAAEHHCSMMPSEKKESRLTHKRIYFDIESRSIPETGLQVPVLFMALKCCPDCAEEIPRKLEEARGLRCEKCSPEGRLKEIECVRPENRFVDVASAMTKWLFSKEHKGFVAVAHNASGYDGQFILEKLIASNRETPSVSLDGTKLVYLNHRGIRLLDSLKYLTMSLGSVAKTFQIESAKGDFPVKFIREENYDHDGDVPGNQFYALENKPPTHRKELEEFLEKERSSGKRFNFVNELDQYCFNDVFILAKAITAFESSFEAMTNVCLLEESVTAASAAVQVFRRNHLQKLAPIVLDAKPSVSVNASVLSQKYLAWIGHRDNVQVDISTTYGEKKVGEYRVDGFVDKCEKYEDGLIIDFRGCYWHGHGCTFAEEAVIGDETVKQIRRRDRKRVRQLAEEYPVKIKWECEVMEDLRNNKEMADFFESYEPLDLLHCERALVGGRTEVFRLHVNNEGQSLFYLDVVSLYPTVMKHEAFPIGPPSDVPRSEIKTPMTSKDDLHFMGFLSCRVLAPRDLKLPLLPGKVDNRLMFFLCRKCAKSKNQHSCRHTDEERSFNGTYTTAELEKALDLGYVITEAYHGVEYSHWLCNDDNCQGGLFTSYINHMMEEKIYSSGWPSNVKTDEEKAAFVAEYKEKEHIDLTDFARFSKNPGKRAVAKLMLNSLWGKLAQRVDRIQTEIVIKPEKFWKIVHDSSLSLLDVRPVNDVLIIKYRKQVETLSSLKTGAVHIAALTTSYARLRLYNYMEKVGGDNIVYTDTDSIVFCVPEGEENPLAGDMGPYLGQLTNEVKGEMTEFVSTGPKAYCYRDRMADGTVETVRKAKGVTMNSEVDRKITFEAMKRMVDEELNEVADRSMEEFGQFTMKRDKDHNVYAVQMKKQFRFTFNKRRVLPDGSTLPFGFC